MSNGWFVKLCTFISTCVQTHGTEVSVYVGWLLIRGCLSFRPGSGGKEWGFRNPLVPFLPQELRVNWSCSMGFLTQAPRPALWKALMSACLAEWYSVAACLASWYELSLSTLIRKMDDSWREEGRRDKDVNNKVNIESSYCSYHVKIRLIQVDVFRTTAVSFL